MDDMKRLEAMIKLIKRSGFFVKGSMEMLLTVASGSGQLLVGHWAKIVHIAEWPK